jgi:hypothetical protein
MHKLVMSYPQQQLLVLVMKPEDFQAYRAEPMFDHSLIDCASFGRPGVKLFISYAVNHKQAQDYLRENISSRHMIHHDQTGVYCFSGTMMEQTVIGILLTDIELKRLETTPLAKFTEFKGSKFGATGFNILITYANTDREVVGLMRGLGMPLEDIAKKPDMASLWQSYGRETVEMAMDAATRLGDEIEKTDIPYELLLGDHATAGTNEQVLIAVRGDEHAWFARNPNEIEYVRRLVPGECPPEIAAQAEWVRVIKIEEGRARIFGRYVDGVFVHAKIQTPHE